MSKQGHLPVVEIFYSLRGEGHWAGSPATFVRLGTCNLACPGCDTEFDRFTYIEFKEVLRWIRSTKCQWVVFTGGEPLIHDERIAEFQEFAVESAGKDVGGVHLLYHLETNGTYEIKHSHWDWITCSPKLGLTRPTKEDAKGVDRVQAYGKDHTPLAEVLPEHLSGVLLTEANEFKMICSRFSLSLKNQYGWLKMQSNEDAEFYVQPWMCPREYQYLLNESIAFCLAHPEVRLSLQTHKLIGVR